MRLFAPCYYFSRCSVYLKLPVSPRVASLFQRVPAVPRNFLRRRAWPGRACDCDFWYQPRVLEPKLISVVRNGCARRVSWIARDTRRRAALSRAAQDAAESVPQSRDASKKEAGADISRKRWQRDRLPHGCGPKRPPEEALWPRASRQVWAGHRP